MENPLPRNEIQGQDFEGRKNQLLYQKKEEKKHSDLLSRKIRSYEENLTALAEYSELIPTEMEEREQLLELSDNGTQVLTQLKTTVQSYDSLMEKLEVDISVVEKEKARIVELMEDYIREIHSNLGKIDHNSTITVRDRNIKMLKIQLPDWDENVGLYHLRLEDFIDKTTMEQMELLF